MMIAEFLLARIAEDEKQARDAIVKREEITYTHPPQLPDMSLQTWEDVGVPAVLVGPERVLADCEAKRALVAAFENVNTSRGNDAMSRLEPLMRRFAGAYAQHPDFDSTWWR